MANKFTKEYFFKVAKEVHGDQYDYSQAFYDGTDVKLTIICKIHGSFRQTPYKHVKLGRGCKTCRKAKKRELERPQLEKKCLAGAQEVHGEKYDYSSVIYINSSVNVKIICPIHGEFPQTPNSHLQGRGCSYCGYESVAKARSYDISTFIQKAKDKHGSKYGYDQARTVHD